MGQRWQMQFHNRSFRIRETHNFKNCPLQRAARLYEMHVSQIARCLLYARCFDKLASHLRETTNWGGKAEPNRAEPSRMEPEPGRAELSRG